MMSRSWVGTKIKQVAVLPPLHLSGKGAGEVQGERTWKHNHIGLLFMGSSEPQSNEDRSRTPLRKKERSLGRPSNPEGEEEERAGRRFFPGPSLLGLQTCLERSRILLLEG